MKEWINLDLPQNLYGTYVHSHYKSFLYNFKRTYNEDEINKILDFFKKEAIDKIKNKITFLENQEKIFLEGLNYSSDENGKQQCIKELDSLLANNEIVTAWKNLKTSLKRDFEIKKRKDGTYPEDSLIRYRQQLLNLFNHYNDFAKKSEELINNALESENTIDVQQYIKSKKNIEELNGKYKAEGIKGTLSPSEIFTDYFYANIDVGWLIEPIIKGIINRDGKFKTKLVGHKYMSSGSVVDLQFEAEAIKNFGINVKSTPASYKIQRSNIKYWKNVRLSQSNEIFLSYLRKNLMALKEFAAWEPDIESSSEVFKKLYNQILRKEKELAFINNLNSALDKDEFTSDSNVVDLTSILISFQGGFLWTSNVLKIILRDIDYIFGSESSRESGKIFSFTTVLTKNPSSPRELYNKKRIILRKMKKNKQSNYYEVLNKVVGIRKFEGYKPLIHSIVYTFNLLKAKGGKTNE